MHRLIEPFFDFQKLVSGTNRQLDASTICADNITCDEIRFGIAYFVGSVRILRFASAVVFTVFISTALVMFFTNVAHSNQAPKVIYESVGHGVGSTYSSPLGIFFDKSRSECYVADTGNHQIVVSDRNGMLLYSFYHSVTRDGETILGEPKSVVVDDEGKMFLTDALVSYLDVLDHRGKSIDRIEPPHGARFECLALGGDGMVYATLSGGEARVAVVGADLTVSKIITLDAPESDRSVVTGLSVGGDGRICITDPYGAKMVQIFDNNGRYIMGFGEHDTGYENFSFPSGIVLMENGEMWVVDTIRQVASCFSADGKFVTYVGGKGSGPGAFNFPSSIASDGEEFLFVLERGGNRYQCFEFGDSE